jgi:hypothetical protein
MISRGANYLLSWVSFLQAAQSMKRNRALTAVFLISLFASSPSIGAQHTTPPPDNTKVNKQGGLTADQQPQNNVDLALTQRIRHAIVKDKSLSTNAHTAKSLRSEVSLPCGAR